MLKKIALTAIFAFASAFSLSTATAVTHSRDTGKISAPAAPRPQGLCFNGTGCR
jgi:hypothetical protein